MEDSKLDIEAKERQPLAPAACYKQLPEDEMEANGELSRPKSPLMDARIVEPDGADEKMLSEEDSKIALNSKIDVSKVEFTREKNGDAKLDIGEVKNEFSGLTKEELMKIANDPFWIRLRWFLFVTFWLLWAGMLVGAILIIIAAPKCSPPTPKTWWEEGPLVTVDVADAKALEQLRSEQGGVIVSFSADTYSPLNATPEFAEFLVKHKSSNIIVQLDPTMSDTWFAESEAGRGEYADYYIWRGSDPQQMPNNWLAKSSTDDHKKPAWKYSNSRKQYYLAPDAKPQLNFDNSKVRDEFKKVLLRFLDAGIDGFLLQNVPRLLVDQAFSDEEPNSAASNYSIHDYKFYTHYKTENLLQLQDVVKEWRDVVKNASNERVLMLADELAALAPFKINGTLLIDLPRHRNVFEQSGLSAEKLHKHISATYDFVEDEWPAWSLTNGEEYPNGTLAAVAYLLKGLPILKSTWKVPEELTEARKSPSVMFGLQKTYTVANNTVFAYIRTYPGNPGYLVAFNPTSQRVEVDFPLEIPGIPDEITVQYFSPNYNETGMAPNLKKNSHKFPISSKSSIIFSYVPPKED